MKNYLNEKSTRSFLNFSIETIQQLFEMVKKVNNGEDINYDLKIDGDYIDDEETKIISNAKAPTFDYESLQNFILNTLNKENIRYSIVEESPFARELENLKFTCLIYHNVDMFVKIIIDKINNTNKKNYIIYFHKNFLEKDGDDIKLYYSFNAFDDMKNTIKTQKKCIDESARRIIVQEISERYPNGDVSYQLELVNRYLDEIKVDENGNAINIDEVLNKISEDSKKVSY